ncbi:DHHC palmitoyltransferase-domain-containing protein, partial [Baffinella frigidus]
HPYTNLHYLGFTCATISVVSYIACTQVDPGFISTDTTDEEARIKKDMAMSGCAKGKICTSCNIRKPLRSKHCSRCGRCVSRFDHHCPWIGNCVGYRNLPIFVTFLTSSTIAGVIFAG